MSVNPPCGSFITDLRFFDFYAKDALRIPHHFTLLFFNQIVSKRPAVNRCQHPGDPPPVKVAAGSFPSSVFGQPPGHVMAGGADDPAARWADFLKMYDTQPVILKHRGRHFKF